MAHEEQVEGGISRRKLIATSATLAAAGIAVGAAGISVVSAEGSAPGAQGDGSVPGDGEPVMVYLQNADSGTFHVFVGERRSSFTDRNMAVQVIQAAASAQ